MTTPASGKAPAKDDEPAYQWTEEMAESVEKLLEHDEANTLCTLDECNTIRKVLLAPESDYWKLEKAKVNRGRCRSATCTTWSSPRCRCSSRATTNAIGRWCR